MSVLLSIAEKSRILKFLEDQMYTTLKGGEKKPKEKVKKIILA